MKWLPLISGVFLIGLGSGFYIGQTYGQLQITCAIQNGDDDLQELVLCAGGPWNLARYVLTRDTGK